jgi:hypothetical protein
VPVITVANTGRYDLDFHVKELLTNGEEMRSE